MIMCAGDRPGFAARGWSAGIAVAGSAPGFAAAGITAAQFIRQPRKKDNNSCLRIIVFCFEDKHTSFIIFSKILIAICWQNDELQLRTVKTNGTTKTGQQMNIMIRWHRPRAAGIRPNPQQYNHLLINSLPNTASFLNKYSRLFGIFFSFYITSYN